MKKLVPFILLTSLILSGCSIDWTGDKDKKIAELEEQIKAVSFEKQKECGNFQKDMQEQINQISIYDPDITAVFYSPKINSCLYTTLYLIGTDVAVMGIQNFFTKETVYSKSCSFQKSPIND